MERENRKEKKIFKVKKIKYYRKKCILKRGKRKKLCKEI